MRGRLVLAGLLIAGLLVPPAGAPAGAETADVDAYGGLGSWVDIFESRAWRRPGQVVRDMEAHGVRTLYLQTSNYRRTRAVQHPRGVSRFIEAAHARGIRVVAWYLPGFRDLRRDLRRSMRAIRFRTTNGHRFDSFALDIEASIVRSPAVRTRRLLRLSRAIRDRVTSAYPLGAIIPAPRGMELTPGYWPGFPYRQLARIYDAFVPMGYFTYRYEGERMAYRYTVRNIRIIRRETGDPSIPIHAIGGVADRTSGPEARGFVRAVLEQRVIGGSLYSWSGTRPAHWRHLERIATAHT